MTRQVINYLNYPSIFISFCFILLISFIIELFLLYNVIIAPYGFLVTPIYTILFIIVWDGYNSKKKEDSIISNLDEEMGINIILLIRNSSIIFLDIKSSIQQKHVIAPLRILRTESWDLLKYNIPNHLFNKGFLVNLSAIYFLFIEINENIISRENFRINNSGMTNYNSTLQIYNKTLHELINSLITPLESMVNSNDFKKEFKNINELNSTLEQLKVENNKIKKLLKDIDTD